MTGYDKIVREERKTLSEEAYLVDLMSELYKAKAEDKEVIFTLTSEAFRKMCAFPAIDKVVVRYYGQSVPITWTSKGSTSEWMALNTSDRGKNYFVIEIRTQEIEYRCPMEDAKVVHYIID